MVKLFVGGFPLDITEIELAKLFYPFGDISTLKLVCDRKTRICKGYAFIEMVSEQDARNAVAGLHDMPMGDRSLTVKFAEENAKPTQSPRSYAPKSNNAKPSSAPSSANQRIKRPRRAV
ncbi:RNA-binding protein [Mucilaginibacter robiniae]|uniref:RNA-binding protein n=1 Tax=Mucilaginibacter robiniae TaxID=2728022 RepID=A0A7L5E0E3_9SPHI|nr:RNA-binding protein [Mucilaginibacter robiniae]QJD95759.1 RNA-binding protein [Mucilaginibacter robiniae]